MYISLRAAREHDKHNTMIPDIQTPFHNIRIVSSILTSLLEKQTKIISRAIIPCLYQQEL